MSADQDEVSGYRAFKLEVRAISASKTVSDSQAATGGPAEKLIGVNALLQRYFGLHEFSAPYPLCSSECEPFTLRELLAMADEDSRERYVTARLSYTSLL